MRVERTCPAIAKGGCYGFSQYRKLALAVNV
jgi:hypothetical protein